MTDFEKRNIWDDRFFRLAQTVADWSSDPSTKVGSVIAGPDNAVRAIGYNGLPRNIEPRDGILDRPLKYAWVEHAERNAIYTAARTGIPLEGCRMYVSWFPCSDCARAVVQVGIGILICEEPDWEHERWGPHFEQARRILEAGGVELQFKK